MRMNIGTLPPSLFLCLPEKDRSGTRMEVVWVEVGDEGRYGTPGVLCSHFS